MHYVITHAARQHGNSHNTRLRHSTSSTCDTRTIQKFLGENLPLLAPISALIRAAPEHLNLGDLTAVASFVTINNCVLSLDD